MTFDMMVDVARVVWRCVCVCIVVWACFVCVCLFVCLCFGVMGVVFECQCRLVVRT
jgi:hypothetical protein